MFSMDSRIGSSIEYFSLITFCDVPETYSTLSDVICQFTWAQNMSPESADYVAIFPVGWKSVDDYVCSQPVAVLADSLTGSLSTHSVTFSAATLPSDSDEFFHFCYVSASDRRVRGVSTPFQFVSDRQNDWELLEPLTMNGKSVEHESVQQHPKQPDMVDESSQVSLTATAVDRQREVDILKQELLNKQQELEKQVSEYNSSMDAMQLSLDEIRRQCVDKDSKLEQLQATLEQYENMEEKHKHELDALKSSHASSLATQVADYQILVIELDNNRVNIEQLKKALDIYQQKEVEWKQHETDLLNELDRLRAAGRDVTTPGNVEPATEQLAAAAGEQWRDLTATDHISETAHEDEQLEDASDVPVDRTCPICSLTFSADEPEELFISHFEDHVVKVCPICTQEFQPDDTNFVIHVNVCIAGQEEQEQQEPPQPRVPGDFDII